MQHVKIQHKKYNTHLHRETELSSPEISMIENGPRQQYIETQPIPFQNDDPINDQIDNTGKVLVAL